MGFESSANVSSWVHVFARLPLAVLFTAAGYAHFGETASKFAGIMKHMWFPHLHYPAVYITGFAEIIGGIWLLCDPRNERISAFLASEFLASSFIARGMGGTVEGSVGSANEHSGPRLACSSVPVAKRCPLPSSLLFWLTVCMTPANVNMWWSDVPFGKDRLSYGFLGGHMLRGIAQIVLLAWLEKISSNYGGTAFGQVSASGVSMLRGGPGDGVGTDRKNL